MQEKVYTSHIGECETKISLIIIGKNTCFKERNIVEKIHVEKDI